MYFLDGTLVNGNAINNLSSGVRNIRILDANGCSFSKDITIQNHPTRPLPCLQLLKLI